MVNSNLAYQEIEIEIPQIKDEPVKWCSVSLSDVIARGKHLEASVFDVEAKQARQIINSGKFPITTICGEKGLANSFTKARFKRVWVKNSDFPIFQALSFPMM